MQLIPLPSRKLEAGENLLKALQESLESAKQSLKENDLLVIASKAVSYAENKLVSVKNDEEFRQLIQKEADQVFDDSEMMITLKNHILIPNAGIDNSNTPEGQVILWPEDAFHSAHKLRSNLQAAHNLKNLGLIISDSHCQPLRWGTIGIAIGWAGFEGVQDERGKEDLFGKKLTYTKMAVADNLASAANVLMGESNAAIPFVLIRDAQIKFTDREMKKEEYAIPPKECIYKSCYNEKLLN